MAERLAASSYPADEALLAELRAAWPPPGAAGSEPTAVLRVAERYGIALTLEHDAGSYVVTLLARDGDRWRRARPGDGLSSFVAGVPVASERAIGVDQTNESVVVGERVMVKWFRRVGPGASRAPLLLAHLEAIGFREIPAPVGTIQWRSPTGIDLTLAQGDAFLASARDGWDWAVERLRRHVEHPDTDCPVGCEPWIGRPIGQLVARLHAAFQWPSVGIPKPVRLAPLRSIGGWHAAAVATLADAIRLTAEQDPEAATFLATIEPALRSDLEAYPLIRTVPIQPVHGDLHVGQVLEWSGGFAVVDFDGNPALHDRGNPLRQPVERDIAQMLMSIDHVGRIVDRQTAGSRRSIVDAWIARTRREFLGTLDADPRLLAAFEVEQECRELVYAARFLPRWRYAPMATLRARFDGRMP